MDRDSLSVIIATAPDAGQVKHGSDAAITRTLIGRKVLLRAASVTSFDSYPGSPCSPGGAFVDPE